MSPALEAQGLCKAFGALVVADAIDFRLPRGARHALIGPNGAGKSTFVNLLTGALAPSSGRVLLDGHDVTGLGQAARVRRGLVRTFQVSSLFPGLPVLENIALAVAERLGIAHRAWLPAAHCRELRDECMSLLAGLGLDADAGRRASELPYGRQRLVELAIALALKPGVLLLDEPGAGVPAAERGRILEAVERLPAGIAVLMIEHDMELVFRFAQSVTVLVQGAVLCEGAPGEVASDPRVRQLYLGGTRRA